MDLDFYSTNNIAKIKENVKRKRISSYDKTGANIDFNVIKPKEKLELCILNCSGIIKHIWMTLASSDSYYLRKLLIRIWWDYEENPSIECPIGDFFGIGHSKAVNYWSLPLSMGPQDGKGFNCFWPMPFSQNARIELENESEEEIICYFYIDYEEHTELD
ncbi:MAG: DUF2961 domain-containing protein, partial [Promethearchaeota archaeon]